MRALIHNPGQAPVLGTSKPRLIDLEEVSADALKAGAARLGQNDQLAIILVADPLTTQTMIRELRHNGYRGPLMVFSSATSSDEIADYLYAGADDVLPLAVGEREMVARINAITRRLHGIISDQVGLGGLTFYLDGRHPEISGQQVKLSSREYAILRHLVMNKERVVTKSAIYDALYALCAMPPFDKIIEVYICRLRAKIAAGSGTGANYIETIPGRGYRLRAPETEAVV